MRPRRTLGALPRGLQVEAGRGFLSDSQMRAGLRALERVQPMKAGIPTGRRFPAPLRTQCYGRRSFSNTAAGQLRSRTGFPIKARPKSSSPPTRDPTYRGREGPSTPYVGQQGAGACRAAFDSEDTRRARASLPAPVRRGPRRARARSGWECLGIDGRMARPRGRLDEGGSSTSSAIRSGLRGRHCG